MNRGRLLALAAALILAVAAAHPAAAGEGLIARRIRITSGENVPPMVPAVLYARLASRVPLIVSEVETELHNTIAVALDGNLTVSLSDREGPVDSREFPGNLAGDPEALNEAFGALAVDWEEYLGLTEPDVNEELVVQREELEEEIALESDLISRFQLTLWAPVAARQTTWNSDGESGANWMWQWPLRTDFTWFFSENVGLTGSFRFEYGNHIVFGAFDDDPVESRNLMLMPGAGILIRTIGELSAEFGIVMFAGAVRMTAEGDMNDPNLLDGESMWIIYPVLSFEPALVWSPGVHWSVKARVMNFSLNLAGFDDQSINYSSERNMLALTYLQFGAAYRW